MNIIVTAETKWSVPRPAIIIYHGRCDRHRHAGVGFARKPSVFHKPGDEMQVLIEGMGGLGNPVIAEQGN